MSEITPVFTPEAPAAMSVYSQAIVANGFVYCSGISLQINSNMQDNFPLIKPVKLSKAISKHTQYSPLTQINKKQCITNLGEVLKAAGSSIQSVVKVNVFLADMADFVAMNEVYEKVVPLCGVS